MIRTRRIPAACGAVLAASAGAATFVAAPAHAGTPAQAATSRWRIADAGPRPGWDVLEAVATSGRGNSWVFGGAHGDNGPMRPVARRWTGKAWRDVGLPRGVVGWIDAASTTSASNVWAASDYGGADGPSAALRWDGHAWTVSHRWAKGMTSDVVTTGRKDVWVFGYSRAGDGVGTWHFNGRRWTRTDLGRLLLGKGSAVSSRDIWAVGATRLKGCGDSTIAHYDGRKWRAVPVGDALPPDIPPSDDGGPYRCTDLRGVLALSHRNVWVIGRLYRWDRPGHDQNDPVILHWNGTNWQNEGLPGEWSADRLASDGHGGLWVTGSTTGEEPAGLTTLLLHRSADGIWRTATIGTGGRSATLVDLARVPGTRTLWGVGRVATDDEVDGVVYRNG